MEHLILFLAELSGHKVTDQQKKVTVDGIVGHMDSKIDGEVVDVKTASSHSFKKFKDGSLYGDDPFGYVAQLSGYEENEDSDKGGFLALNKATLPFLSKLANKGYEKVFREDKNFLEGLNVFKGQVTYKAVAETFGYKYVPANELIG